MLIGVPKEIKNHEYRVGMAPASVREAIKHGHQVMVEANAGVGIGVSDSEYEKIGAQVIEEGFGIGLCNTWNAEKECQCQESTIYVR